MSKKNEYMRTWRRKKRMLKLGAVEISFFAFPEVVYLLRWGLRDKIKLARSKDVKANIKDILEELSKYEG